MAGLPAGQSFTVDALPAWFQALGGSSPTFLGTQPQCALTSHLFMVQCTSCSIYVYIVTIIYTVHIPY